MKRRHEHGERVKVTEGKRKSIKISKVSSRNMNKISLQCHNLKRLLFILANYVIGERKLVFLLIQNLRKTPLKTLSNIIT